MSNSPVPPKRSRGIRALPGRRYRNVTDTLTGKPAQSQEKLLSFSFSVRRAVIRSGGVTSKAGLSRRSGGSVVGWFAACGFAPDAKPQAANPPSGTGVALDPAQTFPEGVNQE